MKSFDLKIVLFKTMLMDSDEDLILVTKHI